MMFVRFIAQVLNRNKQIKIENNKEIKSDINISKYTLAKSNSIINKSIKLNNTLHSKNKNKDIGIKAEQFKSENNDLCFESKNKISINHFVNDAYKASSWEGVKKTKRSISAVLSAIILVAVILSGCNFVSPTGFPFSNDTSSSNGVTSNENSSLQSSMIDNTSSDSNTNSSQSNPAANSSPSPTITQKLTPSPTPTFTIDNKYMYINARAANLRTQPNTTSSKTIITVLHYRTRVKRILILEKWSKVVTDNDYEGYISSEFLSLQIPAITPTPTLVPTRKLLLWPAQTTLTTSFYDAKLSDYIGKTAEYEPLKGITVILDPGHGGTDAGASYDPKNGFSPKTIEKDINLNVSFKIKSELVKMGAQVILTRENDNFCGLYYRNALINKHILVKHKKILTDKNEDTKEVDRLIELMDYVINKNTDTIEKGGRGIFQGLGMNADLRTIMDISREYEDIIVISVHCNAMENAPSASGLEIYYGTNNAIHIDEKKLLIDEPVNDPLNPSKPNPLNPSYQYYNDSTRKALATALRNDLKVSMPEIAMRGNNDGLYAWNFCMIREHNLTSSLIELGYISNDHDRDLLTDPLYQNKMALSIANGVYEYFCKG